MAATKHTLTLYYKTFYDGFSKGQLVKVRICESCYSYILEEQKNVTSFTKYKFLILTQLISSQWILGFILILKLLNRVGTPLEALCVCSLLLTFTPKELHPRSPVISRLRIWVSSSFSLHSQGLLWVLIREMRDKPFLETDPRLDVNSPFGDNTPPVLDKTLKE